MQYPCQWTKASAITYSLRNPGTENPPGFKDFSPAINNSKKFELAKNISL